MKAQTAESHRGFPTALLTFSVMLLVLALGFVVGRVVVARAYMGAAPRIESAGPAGSELDAERAPPGHVYVPSPSASPLPDDAERRERPAPAGAGEQPAAGPQPATQSDEEGVQGELKPALPAPSVEEQQEAEDTRSKAYSIQVGVFSSLQGARDVVGQLTRAGYPARISPEKHGAEALYRVLTGRYRSEYAARKALEQLRSEGFEAFLIEQ